MDAEHISNAKVNCRKVRYKCRALGLSIILPLSLVLSTGSDLLQPNPLPHLLELGLPQRLGEDISQLISGGNVAGLDAPILQTIPDEVVLDANVLASFMEDRILGQS